MRTFDFNERCERSKTHIIYILYDDCAYRFDGDNVLAKIKKGKEVSFNYNDSDDAKEAFYRGDEITEKMYKNW